MDRVRKIIQKLNAKNEQFAGLVTKTVGNMWTAYLFMIIALTSVRENLANIQTFVAWFSSQFLQLVLLPIIMVGTQWLNKGSDVRAQEMYDMIAKEMAELKEINQRQLDDIANQTAEIAELRKIESKLDELLAKVK